MMISIEDENGVIARGVDHIRMMMMMMAIAIVIQAVRTLTRDARKGNATGKDPASVRVAMNHRRHDAGERIRRVQSHLIIIDVNENETRKEGVERTLLEVVDDLSTAYC